MIILIFFNLNKVGKKVIDPSILYSCAITGHLLSGKDGYKCLQDSKIQVS